MLNQSSGACTIARSAGPRSGLDWAPREPFGLEKGDGMRHLLTAAVASATLVVGLSLAGSSFGEERAQLLTIDHFVEVQSTAPALAGRTSVVYVGERRQAGPLRKTLAGRVALFVHGAGTPAEVAFDVTFRDFSWMEFLARAGFDVFAVDMTGYGRSARPGPMNDPCNLVATAQPQ